MARYVLTPLVLLLFVACECEGDAPPTGGPCETDPPAPECTQTCDPSGMDCPGGYHCTAEGMCNAECDRMNGCAEAQMCSPDGRCVPIAVRPDGELPDIDAAMVCADVTVETMQVIPSVILIVDQSGSMEDNDLTPGTTRWDALEDALVGPRDVAGADGMGPGAEGLVFDLQEQVRFGLALYSGEDTDACPVLSFEPDPLSGVDLNQYPVIKTIYDVSDPIRWTPTHLAMREVLDQVLAAPPPEPVLFILATDGEPNECQRNSGGSARPQVITETQRAWDNGIPTYVISLAGDDMSLQNHLDEVANAGQGIDPTMTPPAMSWAPSDTTSLREALTTIVSGALSCTVELNGRVVDPEMACTGTVALDGVPLTCDDPNGWRLVDDTHIEILGEPCDTLLGTPGSMLTATFPCDVVVLF